MNFSLIFSLGQIYIPPIRAKKEYDEKFEKASAILEDNKPKLERFSESLSTYNSKFSFIDQIEQMAKSTQNSTNQGLIDAYHGDVSNKTTERRVSEVPNTEEILNIAHDMNTERIENISMKLSDSLIIN